MQDSRHLKAAPPAQLQLAIAVLPAGFKNDRRVGATPFAALAYVGMTVDRHAGYGPVSQRAVRERFGLSRSTVDRAFRVLRQLGYLRTARRRGPGDVALYQLTIPGVEVELRASDASPVTHLDASPVTHLEPPIRYSTYAQDSGLENDTHRVAREVAADEDPDGVCVALAQLTGTRIARRLCADFPRELVAGWIEAWRYLPTRPRVVGAFVRRAIEEGWAFPDRYVRELERREVAKRQLPIATDELAEHRDVAPVDAAARRAALPASFVRRLEARTEAAG